MRKLPIFAWLLAGALIPALLFACAAPTAPIATAPAPTIPPTGSPATAAAPTPMPEPSATVEPTAVPEPTPAAGGLVQGTDGFPWWNDTVFYQVFIRSFKDSDGDGVGDLEGLISRLDYLNDGDPSTTDDLGVTGIWLMPPMESPSYHGYDVEDYLTIDQEYGTNEDFLRLVDEAHKRGIRVIIDLVINHSGRSHPWFQESMLKESDKRDWYVWEAENPNFQGPWNQTVWHRTPNGYFYGVFCDCMPDFNFRNQEVTDTIHDISRFWLQDMGADGFRMDAIKHLIEEGKQQEFTQATYDWFSDYYEFYKSVDPEAFAVGEAWGPTMLSAKFVGDGMDIVFEFDLADATISSVRSGSNRAAGNAMQLTLDNYPQGQFGAFLRNHDMDRTLSVLDGNENKAKTAGTLLLTSPGVPFIYYGEEIGQQGVRTGNTDEARRLPMQWTDEAYTAGFTTGTPWRAPFNDYETRNVAAQDADPASILSHYRKLIRIRNEQEALRVGEWTFVDSNNAGIAAFLRHTDDNVLLTVVNLGAKPIEDYGLDLEEGPLREGDKALLSLLKLEPLASPVVTAAGGFEDYQPVRVLEPYGNYVIKLR